MECDKKNSPLAELTTTAVTSARAQKLDHLEFIFQQRMCLFNTRRDHEWKIFFGVVFLNTAGQSAHDVDCSVTQKTYPGAYVQHHIPHLAFVKGVDAALKVFHHETLRAQDEQE